jgi:glycine betaine/proline transport system ATP-binding protein
MATNATIEFRGVYKIFGPNPISMINHVKNGLPKEKLLEEYNHVLGLNDVDIEIPACRLQVIMGLSGSGKSTLIRHINRLIEPTVGEIFVGGRNVLKMSATELRDFRRSSASMVFQRFSLLPHRSVADNVAYGLTIQGVHKQEAAKHSQKWVDRVGLSGFEKYYPAQLSGGMQQRVGLARALATDADILLMDEPFSALDPLIRADMQDILLSLQEELNKTIVFITHDLDEALRLGDNIAILRDGIIVQKGPPQDIILNPVNDYVSAFTKDINRGRVLDVGSIMDRGTLRDGPRIDKNMVIEDALQVLMSAGATTATVIQDSQPLGSIELDKMVAALARPKIVTDPTNRR